MSPFVLIALFGWIPCVVILFILMPARKAAAVSVVGAWLLLPPIRLVIPGLPDYSKSSAATIGIVLSTFLFGTDLILKFRPRWFDLPMILWCLTGVASSLHNGLGLYDGISDFVAQFITWGLPYLLGRMYFSNLEALRSLAVAMVIGGLCYVLPCLWEMKMSPQILWRVYGIDRGGALRMGGFRPNVFFQTGIELGMWMTAASITAWWLWCCGTIKRIGRFSFGMVLLPSLLVTTILCRSTTAQLLLVGGIFILWASTRFRTRMLLWALVLFFPIYAAVRIPNISSGEQLVKLNAMIVGAERAKSLEYRFTYENLLIARAMQSPIWGWAGWGRADVYYGGEGDDSFGNSSGRSTVPTDGLWIITFGSKGLVGLTLLYIVMELPVMLFLVRFPVRVWRHPKVAPAAVFATLLGLYMIDCTLNGFINLICVFVMGGLISVMPTELGAIATGLHGTKGTSGQAAVLALHSLDLESRRHAITDDQPNYVLSGPVADRMAMASRYRVLGRNLNSQERWADTHSAWQQAFDILTELMGRYPESPDLQRCWCDCGNDLAWLLLKHPESGSRGLDHALTLAMQVVDKDPDGAVYWNTLGAAYLRNGEPGKAIAALDRASALAGDGNPFNHVFLAMAYARLGNREQARHWLAQALFLKERDYQNHSELTYFCDEARAAVGIDPEAASAVV